MPIVQSKLIRDAPNEPHLAVVIDEAGSALAIPPGASMYIIVDPSRPDKVTPLVLAKVSLKTLTFVCACRNPKCNRVLKYHLKVEGHHPIESGKYDTAAK